MYEFLKDPINNRYFHSLQCQNICLGFLSINLSFLIEKVHSWEALERETLNRTPLRAEDSPKEDSDIRSHGPLSSRKRACRAHTCEWSINKAVVSIPASCCSENFSTKRIRLLLGTYRESLCVKFQATVLISSLTYNERYRFYSFSYIHLLY